MQNHPFPLAVESPVRPASPRLKRRSARNPETWLGAAILLVVVAGLVVDRDAPFAGQKAPAAKRQPATVLVPPRPGDVGVLLTTTPLAIAPEDALAINAARPIDQLQIAAAKPFVLPLPIPANQNSTASALDCMTKAIYYEAAVESDTGQRAVAQVVLNRMRSPIFPHSVCGVVFQGSHLPTGCQFSFTCDGSLRRQPSLTGWMRARRIALAALAGHVERSVGLATHYHANYVVPYWASSLDKVSTIGAHIFYTMRGSLGRPSAFGSAYDRLAEAVPTLLPSEDPALGLTIDGTGGLDALTGGKPRDRTVVQEDSRGELARPDVALPPPVAVLRADENAGGLAADEKKGALKGN